MALNKDRQSRRVLVTGARGTIGTALCNELYTRGGHVFECDAMHGGPERAFSVNGFGTNGTYYRCDVGEYRSLRRVISDVDPDYIFHTAAEFGRWNGEDNYESLWKSNAVAVKHLIQLCKEFDCKLIHFSSSEVYGDLPEMDEGATDRYPLRLYNDYALSKWVNEQQLKNSDIEWVAVRPFNTYGPGEHYSPYRSVHVRIIWSLMNGRTVTVYPGLRSASFLTDAVSAIASIPYNFASGSIYNIGSDQLHTVEDIARATCRVLGVDESLITVVSQLEPRTTADKRCDNQKSRTELGYRDTVDLEEGILETALWLAENQEGWA